MPYKGWYKLQCPEKFIKPLDEFMESYQDGYILYKSRLEQKFMVYCDINKHVTKFSLEPFAINYIKPTDGKVHRYFIDFFVEFNNKDRFLVEIKPFSQTVRPVLPKKQTPKAMTQFHFDLQTYFINQSKWAAAKNFAEEKGLRFVIVTDKELNL